MTLLSAIASILPRECLSHSRLLTAEERASLERIAARKDARSHGYDLHRRRG